MSRKCSMSLNSCLLAALLFFIIKPASGEKVFKSVPVIVKTYENDTVLLPCYVVEPAWASRQRVRWYKGEELLGDSGDPHLLLPPRVRMHANFSLQIDQLQPQDTSLYVCEVIRPDPLGPIRQTHSIEVQYSPQVRTIPDEGFIEVKKGELVDIRCETSGFPKPTLTWRKNGQTMALLKHGPRLRFRAEHRTLGGVYECDVTNGVGDPVRGTITVVILDAPVVKAENSFVHTGVGLRASLAAVVEFAVPAAKTSWYRDGRPVKGDNGDRVVIMAKDNVHNLIFRTVRITDFGNYTFRAENSYGMADVSFKLTGIPERVYFRVDAHLNKATSTSFTLIWEVDSYSTIIEYNLWLRPYHQEHVKEAYYDPYSKDPNAKLWRKIIVPGDSTDGPIHSASYNVRGLFPSTVYEAKVAARNRFGWSELSPVLHFATESPTGRQPSTEDYSEATPLLEEPEQDPDELYNITQAQVYESPRSTGALHSSSQALFVILFYILF